VQLGDERGAIAGVRERAKESRLHRGASKALDGFMSALANFVARIAKLLHLPGFDQKDDAPKPYDPLSSIKATPAPVAAIPDDLRAKRELFQKINPGATLTPSPLQPKDAAVLRYDPLTSVRPPVRQQEPDVRPAPPARPQFDPRASISPTMHSWSSPLPVAVTNRQAYG
jgi:hypothetical protein